MEKSIRTKKFIFLPLVAILALVSFLSLRACTSQIGETESRQPLIEFVPTNEPPVGTSQTLVSRSSQGSDVPVLLWESLNKLNGYFNNTLEFKAGFRDRYTNSAQVFLPLEWATNRLKELLLLALSHREILFG